MFSSIEKSAPDGVLVNYLKKSEAASDEMSASSKPEGFNFCAGAMFLSLHGFIKERPEGHSFNLHHRRLRSW